MKKTGSFRTVKFMSTDRDLVGMELDGWFEKCSLAKPLDRVGVKTDTPLPAEQAQVRDRLEGSNFVIGRHDAETRMVSWRNAFNKRSGRNAPG